MKLVWLVSAGLLSIAPGASAADACMAKARTMADMDACAGSELAAAERELNTVYHDVLLKHAGNEEFESKLRAAQRAWMAFRDAELAARYPDPDPKAAYGSIYPLCATGLKTQLTRARISQLRLWLDGVPEGDVCAGSLPISADPERKP